ncbi:MAG TPA: hypothetical protein VHE34_25675 [Puia sp.]|uniref:hypothetical protein n=1 Tax=Puia sp. TaxID=2045100 RepID=UPI002C855045|nr:hypothetical protein [Puia sp.]HVU98648.1 hypothetical protein [Puia sp.]
MKKLMPILVLLVTSVAARSNISKPYVSSKGGITISWLGDYGDTLTQQRMLDHLVDFMLDHIAKPPRLNLFLVLPPIEIATRHIGRHRIDLVTIGYDSFANKDSLSFDQPVQQWQKDMYGLTDSPYHRVADLYAGDWPEVRPHLQGKEGLKMYFQGEFDSTKNFYDHLLSLVDFAVRHVNEIQTQQKRLILPAKMAHVHVSVLTLDTARLNRIPIRQWGFDPSPPSNLRRNGFFIAIGVALLAATFLLLRRRNRSRPL